ncbi:MAG: hypothetical protein HC930_09420 [Hydrococcus sp. SU_1_0]|nr:hypothetical protein [Hydrococcus sp. SU_1_0]
MFRVAGKVNPDVSGSGEVNPDVQGSGEPLSSENNVDANGADVQGESVSPNGAADAGTEVATKKGKWWWWLLPLLGIPLLAAAIFGGRKKSDQEPALGDLPNINSLDNGRGYAKWIWRWRRASYWGKYRQWSR